jgi:hypothetical protein
MLVPIVSKNTIIYIITAVAIIYLLKTIKQLEAAILILNNEITRMRTEAKWKNDVRSIGLWNNGKPKRVN